MIQNGRNRNEQGKRKAIRVLVRVFFFWKGATSQMKLQSTAKRDPKKSRFESNKESSQRRSLPKKMFRGKEEANNKNNNNNNKNASTTASTKEPLRKLKKNILHHISQSGKEGNVVKSLRLALDLAQAEIKVHTVERLEQQDQNGSCRRDGKDTSDDGNDESITTNGNDVQEEGKEKRPEQAWARNNNNNNNHIGIQNLRRKRRVPGRIVHRRIFSDRPAVARPPAKLRIAKKKEKQEPECDKLTNHAT